MINDDETKAMENRLRTSGWADPPTPSLLSPKHRRAKPAPAKAGFGTLDGKVKEIARWLADRHLAQRSRWATWPTYMEIQGEFKLGYDDSVRALCEAKRLAGEDT